MPWKNTDPVDAANLNTKSGHVFDVRDAEFGAVGDGKTEDHAAIQLAINAAGRHCGRVLITQGTYLIGAPLNVPSNTTIEWDTGAVLKAKKSFTDTIHHSYVLKLENVSNIHLINPQIDCNRAENTDRNHKGVFGIWGDGASHVQVHGGNIRNAASERDASGTMIFGRAGDGIYLNQKVTQKPCVFWRIWGLEISECDRNGISLISCRHSIFDGIVSHENGHVGFDIEPNNTSDRAYGLITRNCVLLGNNYGLVAIGPGMDGIGHMSIVGNVIENSKSDGILIRTFAPVQILGNVVRNNSGRSISIENSSEVSIVGNTITGPNDPQVAIENTTIQECCNIGWKQ